MYTQEQIAEAARLLKEISDKTGVIFEVIELDQPLDPDESLLRYEYSEEYATFHPYCDDFYTPYVE